MNIDGIKLPRVTPLDITHLQKIVAGETKVKATRKKSAIKYWKVLQRDKFRCRKCGHKKDLTIDHKIDRKHNNIEDLRVLCVYCHSTRNIYQSRKNNNPKRFRMGVKV